MPHPQPRRTRRGRGFGLSLVLSLVCVAAFSPAPAAAAPDLNRAVSVATSVFPQVTQRCGSVSVEIGTLTLTGASAESYYYSCRVRIAPATMTTASNTQLCSLMVHEWGHLAGLDHSSDPSNFMNPTVPHNPVCGPPDGAPVSAGTQKAVRQDAIKQKLADLRDALRQTRRAQRRARGAKRARLTRKAKQIERRIRRLKAELGVLNATP